MKKFLGIFCVFLMLALMLDPQTVSVAAKESVDFFLSVLLPSLLPFFILTGIIVETGIASSAGKICHYIMKPLFKINGNGAIALILGILSGFPTGAKTVALLYQKKALTKNEAERLISFANNASPVFMVSVIGLTVFNSLEMGYLLFLANTLAAFSVGVVLSLFGETGEFKDYAREDGKNASHIFNTVVSGSVTSCMSILGFVMFFTIICKFIQTHLHINSNLLFGLLEMSHAHTSKNPYEIATILGFSGLCVLCQTSFQVEGCKLKLGFYFWGKLLFAGFSYLYTKILLSLIHIETAVSTTTPKTPSFNILAAWLFSISVACVILSLFYRDKED